MGTKELVREDGKEVVAERKPLVKNIIGGQVDGISVRAFEIRNASLWNCEIYISKISHSSLNNCKVFNSEIKSSDILDSKLHEVQLSNCGTSNCEISFASLALRRFAPEIRSMILDYCIGPSYGSTPPIVVALRGDPQFYREVLQFYYNKCILQISPKNFKEYNKLPKWVLNEVAHVRIDSLDRKSIKEVLKGCNKLEKVEYMVMGDTGYGYDLDLKRVELVVNDCKTLKVLDVVEFDDACEYEHEYENDLLPFEHRVNEHLGFDGTYIFAGDLSCTTRWVASEGKPLRWTRMTGGPE